MDSELVFVACYGECLKDAYLIFVSILRWNQVLCDIIMLLCFLDLN